MGKPRRRAPRDRSEDGGTTDVSARDENSSTGNAAEVPVLDYSNSEPVQFGT